MRPPHPGTIEFIDGDTSELVKKDAATEVPDYFAWCDTVDGPVPIIRVITRTEGPRRVIREYGPDNQLLRTTRQLKPKPKETES